MERPLSTGLVIGTLAVLLAACGSSVTSPASATKISELKTEFRTKAGAYVACNNTQQGTASTTHTSFALRFSLPARAESATLALKGTTSSQYDPFYTQTVTGAQLAHLQTGAQDSSAYRAVLSADATSSLYLSQQSGVQTLSVASAGQPLKVRMVRVSGLPVGGMYAQVSIEGAPGNTVATSTDTVPVYDRCTVVADTGDRL